MPITTQRHRRPPGKIGFGFRPSGNPGCESRPSVNPGFGSRPSGAVFRSQTARPRTLVCPMDETRTLFVRRSVRWTQREPEIVQMARQTSRPWHHQIAETQTPAPADPQAPRTAWPQHLPDSRNSKPDPGVPQAAPGILPRRVPGGPAPVRRQAVLPRHPTPNTHPRARRHAKCTRNTACVHPIPDVCGRYTDTSRARTRLRPTPTRLLAAHGIGARRAARRPYREGFYV